MTLLSICQDIADDATVKAPASIALATDDTSRKLFSAMRIAGKEIARAFDWDELVTEYTFSTVASQEDYSLPTDFSHLVDGTLWDRTNFTDVKRGVSPKQWQAYKSSVLASTSTIWKRCRIRNVSGTVMLSIFPTPTAVEDLVYEYVSKNWCESSIGDGKADFTDDSDVPIIDEHLLFLGARWRFLDRVGMDYTQALADYKSQLALAKSRNAGGARVISLANTQAYHFGGSVPDTGFGS